MHEKGLGQGSLTSRDLAKPFAPHVSMDHHVADIKLEWTWREIQHKPYACVSFVIAVRPCVAALFHLYVYGAYEGIELTTYTAEEIAQEVSFPLRHLGSALHAFENIRDKAVHELQLQVLPGQGDASAPSDAPGESSLIESMEFYIHVAVTAKEQVFLQPILPPENPLRLSAFKIFILQMNAYHTPA